MEQRSWTVTVEFDWPTEPDTAAFNNWIAALDGLSPAIGYLHRQDGSILCSASLTDKAATLCVALIGESRTVDSLAQNLGYVQWFDD